MTDIFLFSQQRQNRLFYPCHPLRVQAGLYTRAIGSTHPINRGHSPPQGRLFVIKLIAEVKKRGIMGQGVKASSLPRCCSRQVNLKGRAPPALTQPVQYLPKQAHTGGRASHRPYHRRAQHHSLDPISKAIRSPQGQMPAHGMAEYHQIFSPACFIKQSLQRPQMRFEIIQIYIFAMRAKMARASLPRPVNHQDIITSLGQMRADMRIFFTKFCKAGAENHPPLGNAAALRAQQMATHLIAGKRIIIGSVNICAAQRYQTRLIDIICHPDISCGGL